MHFHLSKSIALVTLTLALSATVQAKTYTYPNLVQRLTNLDQLAEAPAPGEKTAMASSYDRNSQYDAVQDKYIRWSANGDDTGIVRKEGNLDVFADIQGPGCITRIWSAKPLEGHVKFYLDGGATPAIDLPFRAYFEGSAPPFDRPEIVYKTTPGKQAGGLNNFTPIPFQKSCKIVGDPGWGVYYQIDYSSFPTGTVVPTFHTDISKDDAAALDHANQILGLRGQNPAGARPGETTEPHDVPGAVGATTVAQLTGPQAITALKVKFDLPDDPVAAEALLRQLALQITWDGDKTPAVWSPLGDFFAYFGGGTRYQSLSLGLLPDGTFYSYWYMPFATGAKVEIVNDGPVPVPMHWEVSHAPLTKPIASLTRFHAKWHRDVFEPTRADRDPDWTLLTTQGTGRYVGTQLHVWNPRGGWWGEGDDKFFVDGEKFPSLFGTGSEDYFGAAWGLSPFDRAFHGLVKQDDKSGDSVVHRWHIVDNVPFATSFEGCIEKGYPNDRPTLYDAAVFWYLNAQGVDPYPVVPIADRLGYWIPPVIRHEPDALEGEDLTVISQPFNTVRQPPAAGAGIPPNVVSGDKYFAFRPTTLGQKVELGIHVAIAGKVHLLVSPLRRRSGGIFDVSVDGKSVGNVDFYGLNAHGTPALIPSDSIDVGVCNLTAGDHVLAFTWTGHNPDIDPSVTFADCDIDFIKLVPAP